MQNKEFSIMFHAMADNKNNNSIIILQEKVQILRLKHF